MQSDKKNSFWLAINFILISVISVITLKMNIEHFGRVKFGIWLVISSLWGFGSTLDFGFGTTIVKYVAAYKKDETEKISILLSSSIFIFVFLGIFIFFVGNIVSFILYFNNPNIIPTELKIQFSNISWILGLSFVIKYITIFFTSIFEGLSRFDITSKLSILQTLLTLLSVIIVTVCNYSLMKLALGYLFIAIIIFFILIIIFINKCKFVKLNAKNFRKSELKKILKFSISVQLMSVFNSLIDPLIKYLISGYYNVNFVPAYEIARRFATAISGLYFNVFKIILPKTSILISNEEKSKFINVELINYCRFGILYSGLFYGVLLLPSILFIKHFFGLSEAIFVFFILSLPESINNYGYGIYNFLLGVGKVNFLVGLQLNNLIITSITLIIGFTLFSTEFALIGYCISVIIGNLLMVSALRKNWNLKIKRFYQDVKIYKLVVLLLSLFGITIFWQIIYKNNLVPIYIFTVLSLTLFASDIIELAKKLLKEIRL